MGNIRFMAPRCSDFSRYSISALCQIAVAALLSDNSAALLPDMDKGRIVLSMIRKQ
jgi:hypothetical protein